MASISSASARCELAGSPGPAWPGCANHRCLWSRAGRLPEVLRTGQDQSRLADRGEIARYVHDLASRPGRLGPNVVAIDSGVGLANATMQLGWWPSASSTTPSSKRVCAIPTRSVAAAIHRAGVFAGHRERGLIPRFTQLPWIPSDEQWHQLVRSRSATGSCWRWRTTPACAAKRSAQCVPTISDPSPRTVRVRAETTKSRRERVVP